MSTLDPRIPTQAVLSYLACAAPRIAKDSNAKSQRTHPLEPPVTAAAETAGVFGVVGVTGAPGQAGHVGHVGEAGHCGQGGTVGCNVNPRRTEISRLAHTTTADDSPTI